MKTRKPISTISYNTIDYLIMVLDQLYSDHVISYWQLIQHKAENDERKDHIHLFLVPNGQLDTMDLQLRFREIDPLYPEKPLGCIDFRSSDPDHWILYNQHFAPYLASKCESREFHYLREHFISSDEDTFDFYYHHAFYGSEWSKDNQIMQHLNSGGSPAELVSSGIISWKQSNALLSYMRLKYGYGDKLDRNGRINHETHEFN